MADERLILGLTAWLRDSDVPPPDSRMSASRVMAGVETTARLGRFWPPIRLASAVEPAPALGAFGPEGPPTPTIPRVRKPELKARLREVFTPVRVLAAVSVLALVCSVVFLAASMLPNAAPKQPVVAAATVASPDPALPQATPTPGPTPTPLPTPTPEPTWAPSDRALDWHTDGVRLEADALELTVGRSVFNAPAEPRIAEGGDSVLQRLESEWVEDGVAQRLMLDIAADESDWWIERIRTNDGRKDAGWIEFGELAARTRTPLGQAWEGNLVAKSTAAQRKAYRQRGSARLSFDALRLSAFGPAGVPTP